MRTIVSFLGRTDRPAAGYRSVRHEFPDGTAHAGAFAGYSIALNMRPDRLVIIGTRGSMWDQLLADFPDTVIDDRGLELLMDAANDGTAQQDQLEPLASGLSAELGCEVVLRIVPDALDADGQARLLAVLADTTLGSTELALDITHGYRHLPMLMFMAALYLRSLRPDMTVSRIWYALLGSEPGVAGMHDIAGMLHFADWVAALKRSELTGDLADVARLVPDAETARLLSEGSFLETIHRGQQARGKIRKARKRLLDVPLEGAGALFQPLLEARTAWVEHQQLYQRQRSHALHAMQRGDFLRAALYAYEAYVTRLVHRLGSSTADINDPETREEIRKSYVEKKWGNHDWKEYKLLNGLRNVLAHGNRARGVGVEAALSSPEALQEALKQSLDVLLPENEPS